MFSSTINHTRRPIFVFVRWCSNRKPKPKFKPKGMRRNFKERFKKVEPPSSAQPIELYSNPYNRWDKFVYGFLIVQVAFTTFLVLYISTPIQDLIPIPDKYLNRFLPPEDPDDPMRDFKVQDTLQRILFCVLLSWGCSIVAFYFRRKRLTRNVTGARIVPSEDGHKLEIDYFFNKTKSFPGSRLYQEMHISEKEWGIVVNMSPLVYYVFQRKHLPAKSKGIILNLMHNKDLSEETVQKIDPNRGFDPAYVFGKE